ncbi:hypothetical protein SUGI_0897870 [Cryptomeria japonica]|uniref:uncharacterized protein LOC131077927 n=1 Tax=Cryptomeria japonica TaxID=3369 RepID=UPI002414B32B|nr:uncharacterized protein LOC131077927 [Cryptomeria japonica]GLJ43245.1 hypothetical protein SUGI_0897870 [Cryptomeria japonica]
MEETLNMRPKRSRSTSLLCCCCFGSDDSTAERFLLKPSWFQRLIGSNPGGEGTDSHKWWRKGWNSVRRASEWSETLVEDYSQGCCGGAKWKHFVRRCKADGKSIYNCKPASLNYDQISYELNFDDGPRDYQYEGLPAAANFPPSVKLKYEESPNGCPNPIKKALI